MKGFFKFLLKIRILVIIITILTTGIFGYFLKDIKINSDVMSYLPADDESVVLFKYIGQEYASSWTAVIIVEAEDVFEGETLHHINDLTSELRDTEGISFASSITNILDIKKTEEGFEISKLIDPYAIPETEEELSLVKTYTMSKEMYKGQLVSENAGYALIMCQIDEAYDKNDMAKKIKSIAKSHNLPEQLYFAGMPFQVESILQFIIDDLLLLTPMIIVLILLTLYLSFRKIKEVLLPIVSVGMGIIWTMGLMALMGIKLSPISDALPVVLFAVGSAYGIHVINKLRHSITDKEQKKEQLIKAMSQIGIAVLLAGVTTFVGFMSFIFSSYLTIIRDFGIFAALGVLFTLILSITFIPAVYSYFPASKVSPERRSLGLLNRFLGWLSIVVIKRRKAILIWTLVIMTISVAGIPFIGRKIDILEYFKKESEMRVSAAIMNQEFGGSLPVQILVKGDILTPEVLTDIKNISLFLKDIDGISHVRSVADYVEIMNDAMDEGKKIPDSKDKILNLWFLIESEDLMSQMINYDKDEAVIYATIKNLDTEGYHRINNAINDYIKTYPSGNVELKTTGLQAVYSKLDDSMMNNLLQSMVLAFIFIFITMRFLIGTFKGAITGMITLFFSVVFVFGFMGFTGIALDIATILIASITVGIGVDYAIHFVSAYKDFLKANYSVDEAVQMSLKSTGRAIVINVVTIIMGFLVLLFANLIPLQQFAILIAVSMFCSGFGSITVMPAFISLFKIQITKSNKK